MKIDIASLIIAALALASFFVPIAWYQISRKRKTRKLMNHLMQFAKEQNAALTEHEVWGDRYVIGLDPKSKKLLYSKHNNENAQKVVIDLAGIENCKVANGTKTYRGPKENVSITNSIRLLFHYQNAKKGPVSLEIYDAERGKTLTTEISVANKWARLVNSLIKTPSGIHNKTTAH